MRARVPIAVCLLLTAGAHSALASSLDDVIDSAEMRLRELLDPNAAPATRPTRARLGAERCLDHLGPPETPRLTAGVRKGEPAARQSARALALCATIAYLAGDTTSGDGWRGQARSLDPQVGDTPGVPFEHIRLGIQLEGALASSRDPRPEPVTLDIAVEGQAPRIVRLPPTVPGSREDLLLGQANTALRRPERRAFEIFLPPGLYLIEVGQWKRGFLVPSDPGDRGPRTILTLVRQPDGGLGLDVQQHSEGYIPPPGVAWPPKERVPPAPVWPKARNASLIAGGVALIIAGGFGTAGLLGDRTANDLSRSPVERRDGLEMRNSAYDGAMISLGVGLGLAATAGVFEMINVMTREEKD